MNSAILCVHCGTACGGLLVEDDGQSFCCTGCKTVYGILRHAGLDSFYRMDRFPGVKPAEKDLTRYAFLDADDVRARMLDFSDGKNARVTFTLPSIHCVACVWLLERLHKLLPGVGRSEVNFSRRTMSIVYLEDQLPLSQLAGFLDGLGYAPDLSLAQLDAPVEAPTQRTFFVKLGLAGFCFGNVMLFNIPSYLGMDSASGFATFFSFLAMVLSIPVVVYSAQDYWRAAWTGIKQARLTIEVPIALGMAALFLQSVYDVISRTGEGYFDSLTGLVFFLLCGKWFQRRSYDALNFERDYKSYFPISVRQENARGEVERIPLDALELGATLVISNGELIPSDARLLSSAAKVDYSFVTGESDPVSCEADAHLYAGGRVIGEHIRIETTKPVSQSYLTSLWDQEIFSKSKGKRFQTVTDAVAGYFTWVIIFIAGASALYWWPISHERAVQAFVAVLIVACPCALALSAPFALGNLLRLFSRNGLYLKNIGVIERMARINHMVFDKTGTLTSREIIDGRFEGEALSDLQRSMIASVAQHSLHPVSQQIVSEVAAKVLVAVRDFREESGCGVSAIVNGVELRIGRYDWCTEQIDDPAQPGTWVMMGTELLGSFHFTQQQREGVSALITRLQGAFRLSLLSGDNNDRVEDFVRTVSPVLTYKSQQTPFEKMRVVDHLTQVGDRVMMLGDGLNDAGAIQQSDVGVAVTEDVQAFSPACDGILRADSLPGLDRFMRVARQGMGVVFASFALSFGYNIIGVSWAVSGDLSPVLAAILMPISSVTVVAFALTATRWVARRNQLEVSWER